ncbi:hypothetical protein CXF68_15230 [Tenacibaculum sp. Bg11-29]|uniref:hypothetical protein n=1 Tax=Tenacibaculum sp. Bg11-29 TaxID=2058306 RepID=UPI000C342CDB|nr:hypothetical protein [Tenacibaculum sp. Bg11-29]PKH51960.1 hypothetical protein CXF68_15230 [Tenacibaculum sp. Bg11-29]
MRYLLTFLVLSIMFSCTPKKKGDPKRFVYGTFEIPAGNGYGKTTIIRKDSLQIETYTKKVNISTDSLVSEKEIKHTDTLFIKWKNNFAYSLRMKSPKTDLDKDPIFVQITKVTDSSFSFTARIGYSNFKQKGTVYKIK